MHHPLSYIRLIGFLFIFSAYTVEDAQLFLYQQAKENYERGDYIACQGLLESLLEPDHPTAVTPYAWFYYALAAYRQAMPEVATQTFTRLIQQYPTWHQCHEALYWLAQLRFEQQDYLTAFSYLAQVEDIEDPTLEAAILQMKKHFLSKAIAPQLLTTLFNQYPHDHTIAKAWLQQQVQLPFMQQDTSRMRQVAQQLKLLDWLYDPLSGLSSVKKDTYHVAIFLPFFIDEVNYEEKSSNHFVIELYQGIQAAVEKLHQEGMPIEVHAYDTKKSASVTAELLEKQEMEYMDLFIGPLYASTFPLVANFAKTHGINLFNPLSVNSSVVGNNSFVYLLKPSLETQARQAAHFTLQQADVQDARIGVVYTNTPEDLLKAHIYKQYIEQHSEKAVERMIELNIETLQQLLNSFRNTKKKETDSWQTSLDIQDLTHIYIASQDELLVSNVLSAIQIKKLHPCIIGDEVWLKKSIITIDQLEQLRINFVAPEYIDYSKESLHEFRRSFYDQFGIYPNYYATVGYDMMFFLGKMLFQYGTYFQKHWKKDIVTGQVFAGFAYGEHHDNQYVPIIRFQDSQFMEVGGASINGL
jgi:hypothetical protein